MTLGDALAETGSLNKAAKTFELAVKLKPDSHGAYYSLGVALGRAHHAEHAHFAFAHATILNPNHAPSHRALALAASMLGKSEEAAVSLRRALHLEPTFQEARFELGVALQHLGKMNEALGTYDLLLTQSPQNAGGHANRGTVLKELARPAEAAEAYDRALSINPAFPEVYNNLAVLYAGDLRQPTRALALIKAGRALPPPQGGTVLEWDSAAGLALTQLRRLSDAASAYSAAYTAAPALPDNACSLMLARMRIGYWRGSIRLGRESLGHLLSGGCERTWDPLYGLAVPSVRAHNLLALSRRIAHRKQTLADSLLAKGGEDRIRKKERVRPLMSHERLRIGYLSADFRWHVMAFLTLGLLKEHSQGGRSLQFDVHALSLSPDDGSGWQQRFRAAVGGAGSKCAQGSVGRTSTGKPLRVTPEGPGGRGGGNKRPTTLDTSCTASSNSRFVDLSERAKSSPLDTARAISKLRLHMLIDLNGYTTDERSEILAFQPARIAMHAVGYPGTMGAPFVPYMLLDRHAKPLDASAVLSESLVLLPHCYQSNNHARTAPIDGESKPLGDEEEDDDVNATSVAVKGDEPAFAADRPLLINFNQLYKVSPAAGALWCGVMRRSTSARLWLLQQPAEGAPQLRAELAACGLHAKRRVSFAPLVSKIARHLARLRAASLLVDTPEYNSHTTASDSLWGGVPMVTVPGEAMAARVGSSLVKAVSGGMGVVWSHKEYSDVAAALIGR